MGKRKSQAKQPIVNRTREQILADLKGNAEFARKMEFTKQQFYPALCAASTSIDDAQMLLSGFNTAIMQEFLSKMKETPLSALKLEDKLEMGSEKYQENRVLLDLFKDMNVYEAKDYIEGMRNELALFIAEEQKERPLSDLKVKWLDELT